MQSEAVLALNVPRIYVIGVYLQFGMFLTDQSCITQRLLYINVKHGKRQFMSCSAWDRMHRALRLQTDSPPAPASA